MSQDVIDPLRLSVITSLGLMLDYLTTHAHLRELLSLQEMMSRHAADVAWYQSPRVLGAVPLPKDAQEMPAELRAQLVEIERQNTALRTQERQRFQVRSPDAPEP